MSQPGWYHDPGGERGRYRHWNGSAWSAHSTSTPGPAGARPDRSAGWLMGVLAVVTVLLIVAVLVRQPGGAQQGGEAIPDSPSPTSGTAAPSSADPSPGCPPPPDPGTGGEVVDGRMRSGGISAPTLPWWNSPGRGFALHGVSDAIAQTKSITSDWQSVVVVGATSRDQHSNPRDAARQLTACLASSDYYVGLTRSTTLLDESVIIDGHDAHRIRTEVYVDNHGPDVPGDVVDVIVIDTGKAESMGIVIASATIGDVITQAEVDVVLDDLLVVD